MERVFCEWHNDEEAVWPADTTIRKEKRKGMINWVAYESIPQQLHLFASSTPKTQKESWLAQDIFKKYI